MENYGAECDIYQAQKVKNFYVKYTKLIVTKVAATNNNIIELANEIRINA